MATSIYITSAEGSSGKSTIALGILDALRARVERVGVFRPVSRGGAERDYVLEMLLDHDGVDFPYEECVGVTYDDVHRLSSWPSILLIGSLARRLRLKACQSNTPFVVFPSIQ